MQRILIIVGLFITLNASAQFQVNNDATNMGGNVYRLTQALNDQAGSVWYMLQHDLTQPLNVAGQMYFGTDPAGADGIAFVMQNNCLAAGTGGGGIGYAGMPGSSISVEFDTYQNISGTGSYNNNDPVDDHIAVERFGNVDHASADNLFGPVQMDPVKTNVEDGLWYDFQINFDPATNLLQVYFNGSLRVSYVYDIRNNIFGGDPFVYWGFTSSTGGFNNEHRVFIDGSSTTYTLQDVTICTGPVQVDLPPLSRFQGQNIALSKTAVASSVEHGGTLASAAIDGNLGTRWASVFGVDPQWIYVDLGIASDLDSVVLYWEGAYATEYYIQTSNDAMVWTDQFHTTTGDGGVDKIIFSAAKVRYVRMLGVQRALAPYGYSLFEFQVYGMPNYVWSPNDGSINDIYSPNAIFNPTVTTTYTVLIPDPCRPPVSYNMTITVDCASLPVDLLFFTAQKEGTRVHLKWETLWERNSDYFTIQRSIDGINFNGIGTVKANGDRSVANNYEFYDPINFTGTIYYRLLMVDRNGKKQTSVVRAVNIDGSGEPYLYPAVFSNETSLILPTQYQYLEYTVVDVTGRQIEHKNLTSPSAVIELGEDLPPAFYLLIIQSDQYSGVLKMRKLK